MWDDPAMRADLEHAAMLATLAEWRRWERLMLKELPAPGSHLGRVDERRNKQQHTLRRWRRVALGKRPPQRRASGGCDAPGGRAGGCSRPSRP